MRYKQRFRSPVGYKPRVYGYGRVSHKRQFDAGNSLDSHEARIKAYYELRKLDESSQFVETTWAGFYAEPRAQSAYSKPFRNRPTGAILLRRLQPEDHLIIDKLDRMWRDQEDFNSMLRHFAENGIQLHFVNFFGVSVDSNSTGGKMMLSFAAMMAEAESMQISDRVKKARGQLRQGKKHGGGGIPFFCRIIGAADGKKRGGGGRLDFKPGCVELMKRLKAAKDEGQRGYAMASGDLEGQIEVIFGHDSDSTRASRVNKLINFYEAWTEAGQPDINTVKVGELVEQYLEKKREANRQ